MKKALSFGFKTLLLRHYIQKGNFLHPFYVSQKIKNKNGK
jgi:hypothetical protein